MNVGRVYVAERKQNENKQTRTFNMKKHVVNHVMNMYDICNLHGHSTKCYEIHAQNQTFGNLNQTGTNSQTCIFCF